MDTTGSLMNSQLIKRVVKRQFITFHLSSSIRKRHKKLSFWLLPVLICFVFLYWAMLTSDSISFSSRYLVKKSDFNCWHLAETIHTGTSWHLSFCKLKTRTLNILSTNLIGSENCPIPIESKRRGADVFVEEKETTESTRKRLLPFIAGELDVKSKSTIRIDRSRPSAEKPQSPDSRRSVVRR